MRGTPAQEERFREKGRFILVQHYRLILQQDENHSLLLGVACDGRSFHDISSARRLRQEYSRSASSTSRRDDRLNGIHRQSHSLRLGWDWVANSS